MTEDRQEQLFLPGMTPAAAAPRIQGIDVVPEKVRSFGHNEDAQGQLVLDFCGIEQCRPGHAYGPATRPVYLVHVVLEGSGVLQIGRQPYLVGPSQAFLLPPGVETYYCADSRNPWHYCWLAFHGTQAAAVVRRIGFSADDPVVTLKEAEQIALLVRRMMTCQKPDLHDQLLRTGLLCTALAHLLETAVQPETRRPEPDADLSYDDFALHYMQQHFREKLRIKDLATRCGISRGYLMDLVKRRTGLSPQQYLIRLRMEYAAHYLTHTRDSIGDVAAKCGYDDQLAFSHAFHMYYGKSPTDYRRDEALPPP